jgi:PAS domain S-box-containing protein
VEVSASLYSKGNQIFSQAIYRDITERKKTEELLAKSAEKYRMIAESVNDCVVLVGDHGTIKYMANSIETIGYGQEEMVGIPGLNITHPDDMERVQKLYREGVKKVWREVTFEIRILHKDGHYVPLEVRAKTFTDPHGKVTGGVFVARNITQTQSGKLEQDIQDTLELPLANISLTPRENEILKWIMQGKNSWEISAIINISESTVKYHIDRAMKKLGAVNRTHAVAIAMRNDLLD